jgi:hypothetical protein
LEASQGQEKGFSNLISDRNLGIILINPLLNT